MNDWFPEYVPDHFQNLISSSLVHNLPTPQILWKSTHNVLSKSANKQKNTGQNINPTGLWQRYQSTVEF